MAELEGEATPVVASTAAGSPVTASRAVRLVGWVFIVLAALMVPWTVYLAIQLPTSHPSAHYDLAWGGFDVGMMLALAATSWAALRVHPSLPSLAAVTGTLLLVDAWFDVVTSPDGDELWVALAMALLVELPLAGVCLWLSVTGHQLMVRRLHHRWRRRSRRSPGLRPGD